MSESRRNLIETIRLAILAILLVGLVGTLIELYLLRHTEGAWELLPVILLGVSLLVLVGYAVTRSAIIVRLIQLVMLAFVVTGLTGVVLHFRVNEQYARESDPSISGWALYREAAYGATPT